MYDAVQALGIVVLRIGSPQPPTQTEIADAVDQVMARYEALHPQDAEKLRSALDSLVVGMCSPSPEIADAALAAFAGVFHDVRALVSAGPIGLL